MEGIETRYRSSESRQIAINTSDSFALADGMTSTEHDKFMAVLPEALKAALQVAKDSQSVGWKRAVT